MDKRINLIPFEMAVPARAVRITKIINKVSTVAALLLIIFIFVVGSLIFYFTFENKKLTQNIGALKLGISALEQNEQKLVLAKDRLAKIAVVRLEKNVYEEVSKYQIFSNIISSSQGSSVTEASITPKGTEVTVVSKDSFSLSEVLTPLSKTIDYKRIILSYLAFNSGSGYISSILLENN